MANERDVYAPLCRALNDRLPDQYDARQGDAVTYELQRTADGELSSRAFRTDVGVFEAETPRVLVEIKCGRVTTHDVITYDEKARRHKDTYPFLRYGLAAFEMRLGLAKRYLWHSDHLDFVFTTEQSVSSVADLRTEDGRLLLELVESHLDTAREVERVYEGGDHEYEVVSRDATFY